MNTVLITGANRGMGWQTACELFGNGYRVYLGTRDAKASEKPVEDVKEEAMWITIDVSNSKSIREASKWLAEREKTLDVLINSAGIFPDKRRSMMAKKSSGDISTFPHPLSSLISGRCLDL